MPCILHSFPETAEALGERAIHLPLPLLRALPPERRGAFQVLGTSCHSVEDAREAEKLGCTYTPLQQPAPAAAAARCCCCK